jgi:CarD family transcriptional regulator
VYEVGDSIVYGKAGVCTVADITTIDSRWSVKDELYYVLKPLNQDWIISAPVKNLRVHTRPAISRSEAEQLIDTIPSITPRIFYSERAQEVVRYYESCMEACDCAELLELTISLYAKRDSATTSRAKFGLVDQRFMTQVEALLFGELAVALGIPRDEVRACVALRMNSGRVAAGPSNERTSTP